MKYRYLNYEYGIEEAAVFAHPGKRIERVSGKGATFVSHQRRYYARGSVKTGEVQSCSSWVRAEDNVRRAKVRWRNGEVAAESSVSENKAARLVREKIAALKERRYVFVVTLHDNVAGIFTSQQLAQAYADKHHPMFRIVPCELNKPRLDTGKHHTSWWSPPWLVAT